MTTPKNERIRAMSSAYVHSYGSAPGPQPELCTFFLLELPWAFGKRGPGMRKHLPPPWWDKLKIRKSTARSRRRLRRFSKRGAR